MILSLTHSEWFILLAASGLVKGRVALWHGKPHPIAKIEDHFQKILYDVVKRKGNVNPCKKFTFRFDSTETNAIYKMAASCKGIIEKSSVYTPQLRKRMVEMFTAIDNLQTMRRCHDCYIPIAATGPSRCKKCLVKQKEKK
jgi:hypothetical protein